MYQRVFCYVRPCFFAKFSISQKVMSRPPLIPSFGSLFAKFLVYLHHLQHKGAMNIAKSACWTPPPPAGRPVLTENPLLFIVGRPGAGVGFVVVAYSSALKKNRNLFGIWKTKFQQKVPLQVQKPLALGSPSVFIYGKKRVKLLRVFKGVRLLEIFVFFSRLRNQLL